MNYKCTDTQPVLSVVCEADYATLNKMYCSMTAHNLLSFAYKDVNEVMCSVY